MDTEKGLEKECPLGHTDDGKRRNLSKNITCMVMKPVKRYRKIDRVESVGANKVGIPKEDVTSADVHSKSKVNMGKKTRFEVNKRKIRDINKIMFKLRKRMIDTRITRTNYMERD